jgi:hypothetical protein
MSMHSKNLEAIGRAYIAFREHERRNGGPHKYGEDGCVTCRERAAAKRALEAEYQNAVFCGPLTHREQIVGELVDDVIASNTAKDCGTVSSDD